jgi:hypothetical protein
MVTVAMMFSLKKQLKNIVLQRFKSGKCKVLVFHGGVTPFVCLPIASHEFFRGGNGKIKCNRKQCKGTPQAAAKRVKRSKAKRKESERARM